MVYFIIPDSTFIRKGGNIPPKLYSSSFSEETASCAQYSATPLSLDLQNQLCFHLIIWNNLSQSVFIHV